MLQNHSNCYLKRNQYPLPTTICLILKEKRTAFHGKGHAIESAHNDDDLVISPVDVEEGTGGMFNRHYDHYCG